MKQVYGLYKASTGELIVRKKSALSLDTWHKHICVKILKQVRKERFHEAIRSGDTIAGWDSYDAFTLGRSKSEADYARVMTGDPKITLKKVVQNDVPSILAQEGGQNFWFGPVLDLYSEYAVLDKARFSELEVRDGKDTVLIDKWRS